MQVSFNHPDLPQEEKERRLILIEMAGGNRKASGQKIDELFEEAKKNTEIVNDWELETSNLWNIAKRKWAKKRNSERSSPMRLLARWLICTRPSSISASS